MKLPIDVAIVDDAVWSTTSGDAGDSTNEDVLTGVSDWLWSWWWPPSIQVWQVQ